MKLRHRLLILLSVISYSAGAQVEINKPVILNAVVATDRKLTGLADPAALTDATSAGVIQKGKLNYSAAGSAVNNYTVTLTPALDIYVAGTIINFKAGSANTGSSTLNVNGLGAKSILKNVTDPLVAGDIKLNQLVSVMYDGTSFQVISVLQTKLAYSRIAKISSAGNSSYTASANDDIVGIDQTSGTPFTVTLPPATVSGRSMIVKLEKQYTTTFPNLSISRGGTDTIDGSTSPVTFSNPGGSRRFYSDGAGNWNSW